MLFEHDLLEKQPLVADKTGNAYRYGFQGQESDDEVKGAGNSVNYKYRMHDPRVGRFFAVDPLAKDYPELTPYQFSSNSPIYLIEVEGLEGTLYTYKSWYKDGKRESSILSAKVVQGLNYDVIKSVMIEGGTPKGKVHSLQYALRSPEGGRAAPISINLDNKPNVEELNQMFKSFESNIKPPAPEKSFAQSLNEKAPAWLKDGAMEGTKGLKMYSGAINNVGLALQYTGVGAPLGRGLTIVSDAIDSGLEIKSDFTKGELSVETVVNVATRFALNKAGGKVEKAIESSSLGKVEKIISRAGTNHTLENAEGAITSDK